MKAAAHTINIIPNFGPMQRRWKWHSDQKVRKKYTSGFASTDYITQLFKHYHIEADGIINGTTRLKADDNNKMKQAKSMLEKKYPVTLHIDTDSILRTRSGSKEFEQYEIVSKGERWANNVITIVRSLK